MPHRKSLGLVWRRIRERYCLEGTMCSNCSEHFFPPRKLCPNCRRQGKIEKAMMKGTGKIHSYTTIHVPLEGFEEIAPYTMAIIELDEGPKLTAMLCDVTPDEVSIGMPVQVGFRKISEDSNDGIIHYGYKFAPIKSLPSK